MERIEEDATPAEEWLASLRATCNRLSTQYYNMIKAASSVSAQTTEEARHDSRGKKFRHPPYITVAETY
jgi:phytoene/squalene synthetase